MIVKSCYFIDIKAAEALFENNVISKRAFLIIMGFDVSKRLLTLSKYGTFGIENYENILQETFTV